MGYLATGFNNVDDTDDSSLFETCLSFLNTIEFFKEYKEDCHRMLDLMPGLDVLDVGFGLGDDLLDIANEVGPKGVVTGVDSSEAFLELAKAKINAGPDNIKLINGDALNLQFEDNSFDRCKIDRTLQHVVDPKKALSEIYRVLKPGGIMLAFDNDWETFTFSSTNRELVRRVANYWCDSFTSGWVGRYLYNYFSELGLDDIEVHPRTLVVNDLEKSDKVFDLFQTINRVVENRIISSEEADMLLSEIKKQDMNASFFSSYTGFIVLGRKPE